VTPAGTVRAVTYHAVVTDAAEIRALEDRRYAATTAGDLATLEELFADTLVYTHSSGAIDTKASYLDSLRSGRLRYRVMDRLQEDITVYDGAAVVSSRVRLEITVGGVDRTINGQATITWVRQGDTWRFAAWQSTPVPA
jgi:ketosteroid isomerase-like protein